MSNIGLAFEDLPNDEMTPDSVIVSAITAATTAACSVVTIISAVSVASVLSTVSASGIITAANETCSLDLCTCGGC